MPDTPVKTARMVQLVKTEAGPFKWAYEDDGSYIPDNSFADANAAMAWLFTTIAIEVSGKPEVTKP